MNPREVILRPVITEKSLAGIDQGRYTFVVDRRANKVEIRRAVEQIWNVRVLKVNTMIVPGKRRRVGRSVGWRPDWKKAIVTLRPGDRIPFFEGLR